MTTAPSQPNTSSLPGLPGLGLQSQPTAPDLPMTVANPMTVAASDPPFQLADIDNCLAGTIVYPPGGRFGPRVQADVQLVMLYSGAMEIILDGVSHQVPPGTVTLLKPGHTEAFFFDRQQETWHRWIAVHFHTLSPQLVDYLYSLPFYVPLTEELNRLTDLMLTLDAKTANSSQLMRSLGLAALHLYPLESAYAPGQHEKHPSVYRALALMNGHYAEELTLARVADEAGVTPEHLIRLFRRDLDATPMQYLWRHRTDKGIELLIHTGLAVSEIAERVGFKTSHHFATVVKQQTGRTPTEIRSMHWKPSHGGSKL